MGFAQGEAQALFQLLSVLLLIGEIPLYLVAVNKTKEGSSCTGYKIALLLIQGIVILSFMSLLHCQSIGLALLFVAMFFVLPLIILSFLKRFMEKKSVTAHILYFGIFQIIFLLVLFSSPETVENLYF